MNNAPLPEVSEEGEPVLFTAQLNAIQTPLYNPAAKQDADKLNYYISENFLAKSFSLPDRLQEYAHRMRLENMLDFSRRDFNKAISLTIKKVIKVVSKWEIKTLAEIANISRGASPRPISNYITEDKNGVPWIKIGDAKVGSKYITSTDEKITIAGSELSKKVKKGDFVISNSMSVGRPFILDIDGCIHDGWLLISSIDKSINEEYLYEILSSVEVQEQFKDIALGGIVQNLNTTRASGIRIPVPPQDIQKSIVAECRTIDDVDSASHQAIENAKKEIESKVEESLKKYPIKSLATVVKTNPSKSEIKNLEDNLMVSFVEMASVSNDGYIEQAEDRVLKSLRKGSYTYFSENDVIVAKITPCMENGKCALAKKLTNAIGMGSSEFHVFRTGKELLPPFLFYQLNRQSVRDEAEKNMTGSSGHRRVPISFYENLRIPIPSIDVQQKLVEEIEILEARIATAQHEIAEAPAKKQAVLKKWLE